VAIIDQALARRFWPGYPTTQDPLEDRLILGRDYGPEFVEPARQIIGVAADVRGWGLNHEPQPMLYVPMAQVTDGIMGLIVRDGGDLAWIARTRGEPQTLASSIETELRETSGGLPAARVYPMEEVVRQSTAREQFNMGLLTVFGCVGLVLAALGIYGLMAGAIEQRAPELGIRLALGAESRQLRQLILSQGMRLTLVGLLIGESAALVITRFMASMLFGVDQHDALVFAGVPVRLGVIALLSVWFPARRAGRVDPVRALRCE
jgi:ABC-type antimicrobial peptide transport system permease subunit